MQGWEYSINPLQTYLDAEKEASSLFTSSDKLILPGTSQTRRTDDAFIRYDPYYNSYALHQFLQNPDAAIERADFGLLKTDRTSTVAALSFDGRKYVVKRYNNRNLIHALRRAVRKTRAENCWTFSHRLLEIGVRTAHPVAMLEKRLGPFKGKAYYLTEFVWGELCNEHLPKLQNKNEINELVEKFVALFRNLLQHRLSHGDTKATNFVIQYGEPIVLDLDAMRAHDNDISLKKAVEKDRLRFLRNWEKQPELQRLFKQRLSRIVL